MKIITYVIKLFENQAPSLMRTGNISVFESLSPHIAAIGDHVLMLLDYYYTLMLKVVYPNILLFDIRTLFVLGIA